MSMKPGSHTLHVRLDTGGAIAESDEGNNAFDITFELTGKCSKAQPTDDPGKRTKLAKQRATPTRAVEMLAEQQYELVAVPRMKVDSKYKRAEDVKFQIVDGSATLTGPKLWLRMHEIEYYTPYMVPRRANGQMGWNLRTPSSTMRDDESLLIKWRWSPDADDAPALSTLDEPTSALPFIDGKSYATMVDYDAATQSLTSFAHGVPMKNADWPLEISLVVREADQLYAATKKTIGRGSTYDDYDAALTAVFSHDRCTSCHSVGSEGAIADYHWDRNGSRPDIGGPQEPDSCMSCCHYQAIDRDWRSPRFDQDLDFSQMTTRQICVTMTTNLDDQSLWEHFRDDPRVHCPP